MKKIIEGKIWTAVCVALTLLMIVSAIWIGMRYYVSMDIYETPSMFLEGEYSVDGGEWHPIEKDRYITDHFNKIVFKGKMSKKLLMYFGSLTISSKNVWYTLKTTDGTVIRSYNALAVNPDVLDCDYYRFKELDAGAVNAYQNEYMSQYYWADFLYDDYMD